MNASILFLLLLLCISLNFNYGLTESTSDETKNKFRERDATDDALGYPNLDEDELLNKQCPQNLELRWQTEVSSSIYATPLIADINSDGKLDVVVPSFVHYLEVLEGSDGDKMPGWPAFHQSTVHASPLLYDIDKDGVREIALATYNGEVLFFRVSGYMMSDKLEVPRLKVKRDWHVGLNPDPVDRSHPDVHDDQIIEEALLNSRPPSAVHIDTVNAPKMEKQEKQNNSQIEADIKHSEKMNDTSPEERTNNAENHTNADIKLPNNIDNITSDSGPERTKNAENGTNTRRRLLQDQASKGSEESGSGSKANTAEDVRAATVENDAGLEADADSSFELFRDSDELADEYNYDYDDYVDDQQWGDEEWTEAQHEASENYVNIDSHILCTPVVADIDNDGVSEMIVAVSYFFDHEWNIFCYFKTFVRDQTERHDVHQVTQID